MLRSRDNTLDDEERERQNRLNASAKLENPLAGISAQDVSEFLPFSFLVPFDMNYLPPFSSYSRWYPPIFLSGRGRAQRGSGVGSIYETSFCGKETTD